MSDGVDRPDLERMAPIPEPGVGLRACAGQVTAAVELALEVDPASLAENEKLAPVAFVGPAGAEEMVVSAPSCRP